MKLFKASIIFTISFLILAKEAFADNIDKLKLCENTIESVELQTDIPKGLLFFTNSIQQLNKNKNMNLKNIDFNKIPSLSKEILEKLNKFKPENLYDAGKISGITPSALFQIVKHKKIKGDRVA